MTKGHDMPAHFEHKETKAEATPPEWLPIGVELARLVNKWARREDIIAYVGPGAGGDVPACFNPGLAEMEVNVAVACHEAVRPDELRGIAGVDTEGVVIREENPVLVGALFHEGMHARHSLWDIPTLYKENSRLIAEIVVNLEETRIEGLGLSHYPKMREFLRACAVKLVIRDMPTLLEGVASKDLNPLSMSLNAQLTLGRVDAGVLESSDVSALRSVFEQLFGDELLAKFRSIWIRAQAIRDDGTLDGMTELAQEWIDLLVESEMIPDPTKRKSGEGEPGEGAGTGTGGSGGEPGEESEPGEGGAAISEELARALADALSEAADVAEIEALGAIADEQEAREWAEQVESRGKDAREERDHKGTAAKVFGKGTGPGSGATSSRLVETRKASGPERAAAVKVAQMLERARYQERLVTNVASVLPPGRLRSRAMVQAGAERARGAMQTAEPWRAKHRKHVDDPTLQIGVMCDISGSMYAAMEPMGVLAWVFAEASRRIGAKVAQVYYGNSVFATLRPGEYQPDVRIYSAPDGTESFDQAFKALDGTLNLLHGSGARLLVISSDMYYTGPQTHAARKWVKRLTDAGVAVLIMGYGGIEYGGNYEALGATIVDDNLSPADAALAVGKAAAAAIERASAQNER
jgi:hypothetical protein